MLVGKFEVERSTRDFDYRFGLFTSHPTRDDDVVRLAEIAGATGIHHETFDVFGFVIPHGIEIVIGEDGIDDDHPVRRLVHCVEQGSIRGLQCKSDSNHCRSVEPSKLRGDTASVSTQYPFNRAR